MHKVHKNEKNHFICNKKTSSKTVGSFQNDQFLLFQWWGNVDLLDFLQKKFYKIDHRLN